MNIKMNRSRIETRGKIEAAFIEQLQTKRVPDITVTDVCNTAEINRSTFYENYANISALATEVSRHIERTVSQVPHAEHDYAWLFEYAAAHRDMFDISFEIDVLPEAPDYKTAYIRNGIRSVVKSWFKNGCQESAEFMNRLLLNIIH